MKQINEIKDLCIKETEKIKAGHHLNLFLEL